MRATFASKAAGIARPATATGLVLGGASVANYTANTTASTIPVGYTVDGVDANTTATVTFSQSPIYAGLAITSHNNAALSTARTEAKYWIMMPV